MHTSSAPRAEQGAARASSAPPPALPPNLLRSPMPAIDERHPEQRGYSPGAAAVPESRAASTPRTARPFLRKSSSWCEMCVNDGPGELHEGALQRFLPRTDALQLSDAPAAHAAAFQPAGAALHRGLATSPEQAVAPPADGYQPAFNLRPARRCVQPRAQQRRRAVCILLAYSLHAQPAPGGPRFPVVRRA